MKLEPGLILGGLREIAEEPVSAGVGMCTAGSLGSHAGKTTVR